MTHEQHRSSSQPLVARCAIITLSDTRTQATDTSGRRIRELLEADGHQVGFYQIIRDEPAELEKLLLDLLARQTIDVVLTTGGTGISRRDQTIPLIQKHLAYTLPGFGELFRMLSWQQIGSAAMLSRAVAGIANGKPIFTMPGSTKAVELAMTRLILPELRHLLYELRK
ncbi:MAG TPA: MogA/MoaB family molybdenum cofactor biosynthesis protein [Tepidisphaeraceae bacterium]|nr:MogA/MoaB family molybdenum cofactor biosynthesis protein [Tepidisphaeraceae bacterium]